MKKNQNSSTRSFFSFLADTLSISNIFTSGRKNSEKKAEPEMKTEEEMNRDYFDFLANSLSISTVVA